MGFHYPLGSVCNLINRLKVKCKTRPGRFNLRATLGPDLVPGTELTLAVDGEDPRMVTIKDSGRGRVKWKVFGEGEREVCVDGCGDICRSVRCRE